MEWLASWLKGLTFTNVAVTALMAMVAIPTFAAYRLLTDPAMLDRWLSSYEEYTEAESGCTVRTVRLRGGPWRWSISTGFAMGGNDRYTVSVILTTEPTGNDIASYCATLALITDKMLGIDGNAAPRNNSSRRAAGRRVFRFAVQGAEADARRHPHHLLQASASPAAGLLQPARQARRV